MLTEIIQVDDKPTEAIVQRDGIHIVKNGRVVEKHSLPVSFKLQRGVPFRTNGHKYFIPKLKPRSL